MTIQVPQVSSPSTLEGVRGSVPASGALCFPQPTPPQPGGESAMCGGGVGSLGRGNGSHCLRTVYCYCYRNHIVALAELELMISHLPNGNFTICRDLLIRVQKY